MQNFKSNNLKTKAYNEIRRMILLRELKPGEKIFEKDVAERMRMSRTPVREALLILEREQFVVNQDRLGFIVRRPTDEEIKDYFDIRDMLEQRVAPLIVANITDEEVEALEKNVTDSEGYYAAGDTEIFHLSNGNFLELLFKATHSALYFRMISNLNDITTLLRVMSQKKQEGMTQSLSDHRRIIEALKARNVETLKKSLSTHLKEFKDQMGLYLLV